MGDTFSSVNPDSSLSVSLNELVLAGLSQYKSEPVLELRKSHWKSGSHTDLAIVVRKYLGVIATLVPSKLLFSTAGNIVNAKQSPLDLENVESCFFA